MCVLDAEGTVLLHRDMPTGLGFTDASTAKSVDVDLDLLDSYDEIIRGMELFLVNRAKEHDVNAFHRLRSVPGIGKILALTILYEIHDIGRFERVQDFASYSRLVKGTKSSAGKKFGPAALAFDWTPASLFLRRESFPLSPTLPLTRARG